MKSINFAENNNVVRNANIERLRVEINAYERLSDTDLRNCIKAAQNGSQRAKDKAVRANLRFVWSVAASYGSLDKFEDIYQNGAYGLCKAIETFDVSRGTTLQAWMHLWGMRMVMKKLYSTPLQAI